MTPIRNEEDQRRSIAMSELQLQIHSLQKEHGLSTFEVISALSSWIQSAMKYAIREERREERKEITLDMTTTALSRFVPDWHEQDGDAIDDQISRMQAALKEAYYGSDEA